VLEESTAEEKIFTALSACTNNYSVLCSKSELSNTLVMPEARRDTSEYDLARIAGGTDASGVSWNLEGRIASLVEGWTEALKYKPRAQQVRESAQRSSVIRSREYVELAAEPGILNIASLALSAALGQWHPIAIVSSWALELVRLAKYLDRKFYKYHSHLDLDTPTKMLHAEDSPSARVPIWVGDPRCENEQARSTPMYRPMFRATADSVLANQVAPTFRWQDLEKPVPFPIMHPAAPPRENSQDAPDVEWNLCVVQLVDERLIPPSLSDRDMFFLYLGEAPTSQAVSWYKAALTAQVHDTSNHLTPSLYALSLDRRSEKEKQSLLRLGIRLRQVPPKFVSEGTEGINNLEAALRDYYGPLATYRESVLNELGRPRIREFDRYKVEGGPGFSRSDYQQMIKDYERERW